MHPVATDAHPPALVLHRVVDAFPPGVTLRFHGVPGQGTQRRRAVADAHVHGVGRMSEMIGARVVSRLRRRRMRARRGRKTQARRGQGLGRGLERHGRKAVRESEQSRHRAAQRMSRQPDVRLGVQFGHVGIQVQRGTVVSILVAQLLHQARLIAGVHGRRAVADLPPQIIPALATAAAEEEVVVDLVVDLSSATVVDGARRALEGHDDGRIGLVGKDMTAQSIRFPAKAVRVIVATLDVFPIARVRWKVICVCGHACESQDASLVGDIGTGKIVDGPSGRTQGHDIAVKSGRS